MIICKKVEKSVLFQNGGHFSHFTDFSSAWLRNTTEIEKNTFPKANFKFSTKFGSKLADR